MTISNQTDAVRTSKAQDLIGTIRRLVSGRRGMLVLGALALAAGVAFKWNWLVAAGIAPLVIGLLPCAVMCALGVGCMYMATSRSQGKPPAAQAGPESPPDPKN